MTFRDRLARRDWPVLGIVLLGALVRLWALGAVPAGLNPDEASIAYDGWALLHYGLDRNGQSWPVHLIAWGSGQNALYAYLSFPFLAAGMDAWHVRLTQAILGIATLPLVHWVAARIFDRPVALIVTAFVAFSPWHVAMSRWALESNLVVAVFLAGFAGLIADRRAWRIAGAALLGLSLYAYGSAYVAAPLLLAAALILAVRDRRETIAGAAMALAAFLAVAAPIILFVTTNSLRGPALTLGPLTIPRLTSAPRYETQAALDSGGVLATLGERLAALFTTVVGEGDGLPWNATPPFGLFFHLLAVLALVGAWIVIRDRAAFDWRRRLLLCWVLAVLPVGLIQTVNVNRINLIFLPLLILAAVAANRAGRQIRIAVLAALALGFAAFWPAYLRQDRPGFDDDLVPAIRAARSLAGAGQVCLLSRTDMPYVYALIADRTDPRRFAASVRYADPAAPFRKVLAFERYRFDRCDADAAVMVLDGDDDASGMRTLRRVGRYAIAARSGA